ncbi:MAG: hypothetical protein QOI59_753 [Gammaproteobacteria bacterium]|jgi:hypothetical protein|nr:hypothetical protein [Gammaproteobacteria bacterium]
MTRTLGLLCLVLLAVPLRVLAAQDTSLTLRVEAVSLQAEWQVRLSDLSSALQLDSDHDGEVTWPEIEHRRADIETYLAAHLAIAPNGTAASLAIDKLVYGARDGEPFLLAQMHINAAQQINTVGVRYTLGAPCQLSVVWLGRGMQRAQISASGGVLTLQRSTAASSGFLESFQQGVWHIWTGYDHILFLIVLLIPAVFRATVSGREAVPSFKEAALRVIIIVSAFTAAHSITLACAALNWIRLPSRLVESVIAASIFIAALNNFLPRTAGGRSAWLAFGFGLIHGFGFAGALSEIGAEGAPLWRTLLAFNLGVETGQLAIVAAFLPVAYSLRQTHFYRTAVLYGGSCAAGLCALFWFWERAIRGSI